MDVVSLLFLITVKVFQKNGLITTGLVDVVRGQLNLEYLINANKGFEFRLSDNR